MSGNLETMTSSEKCLHHFLHIRTIEEKLYLLYKKNNPGWNEKEAFADCRFYKDNEDFIRSKLRNILERFLSAVGSFCQSPQEFFRMNPDVQEYFKMNGQKFIDISVSKVVEEIEKNLKLEISSEYFMEIYCQAAKGISLPKIKRVQVEKVQTDPRGRCRTITQSCFVFSYAPLGRKFEIPFDEAEYNKFVESVYSYRDLLVEFDGRPRTIDADCQVLALYLRYAASYQQVQSWMIDPEVVMKHVVDFLLPKVISDDDPILVEGFSSPFNMILGKHIPYGKVLRFSAMDTDCFFGHFHNFFTFVPEEDTSYGLYLNPPHVDLVIEEMAKRVIELCESYPKIRAVLYVPDWDVSFMKILRETHFKRSEFIQGKKSFPIITSDGKRIMNPVPYVCFYLASHDF